MGIVQSRAECSASEVVIEFIEVVHVSQKLSSFHKPLITFVFQWCGMDSSSRKALHHTIPILEVGKQYLYMYIFI